MKTLKIEWLRLVSEGQTCPRCGATEEELEKAIFALRKSLNTLGMEVVLEKRKLSISEFKKDPLLSNQIRLNGRLLEDWIGGKVSRSPCCDVCGPSECRTIGVGGDVHEAIPAVLVIKAGLLAASELVEKKTEEPCCDNVAAKTPPIPCCPK